MSKYDPLRSLLERDQQSVITLTFADIERVLGTPLPQSAFRYPAWWANESEGGGHVHARSWLDAGRHAARLDLNAQTVEFVRQ